MNTDCILAGGTASGSGHHRVWSENKKCAAHRIAYCRAHNLTLSDIEGFVVMHTCDNPACVNPAHLKLGTQGMNVRDMWEKGRQGVEGMPGSKHPMAKINEDDVRWMRTEGKRMKLWQLAAKYGISVPSVSMIMNGRTWKHVK